MTLAMANRGKTATVAIVESILTLFLAKFT